MFLLVLEKTSCYNTLLSWLRSRQYFLLCDIKNTRMVGGLNTFQALNEDVYFPRRREKTRTQK